MGLENTRGRGGDVYVFLFSSPIALPLYGLKVYIFAADWPLIKDHTPSAGESIEEKGGRDDRMRYGGRDNFTLTSPKPIKDTFHNFIL